jgi:hypothetical protein
LTLETDINPIINTLIKHHTVKPENASKKSKLGTQPSHKSSTSKKRSDLNTSTT